MELALNENTVSMNTGEGTFTIGIISDTHGLLRPEAVAALQGVDHILHAGDVGKAHILEELAQIAPTTAIRGNIDKADWAQSLPETEAIQLAGHWVYVLHNIDELDLDPATADFSLVVYGHSHKPKIHKKGGVLYFNPGSAGPRRFSLPISIGSIRVENGKLIPELIELVV